MGDGPVTATAVSFPVTAALPAITITSANPVKAEPVTSEYNTDELVTIGVYTKAQRRAKIIRYREKRDRRTFKRKVLYTCRKAFADTRPRVGGRFVKTNPSPSDSNTSTESTPKPKKWRGGRIRKPKKQK